MTSVSKQVLAVGGIAVNVFTESQPAEPSLPPAILFFVHGRLESAEKYEPRIHQIFSNIDSVSNGTNRARNLIVVTLDQRNHGTRLLNAKQNDMWNRNDPEKHNETHAVDMYAIQVGTARDISYLIDFLPAYLFPYGLGPGHEIEWLIAGVSLGGHATWLVLRNEPRVNIGIPIIGCADYLSMIKKRAENYKVDFRPPLFPDHMRKLIAQFDPAAAPHPSTSGENPFLGKKILALSGGKDPLVPFDPMREFFQNLNVGSGGIKQVIIEPETPHAYTDSMALELSKFVWEHALKPEPQSAL